MIFILHSFFPISHSSSSSSLGPHLIRKFVMGMGSSLLGPTEDFHVYPQQTVWITKKNYSIRPSQCSEKSFSLVKAWEKSTLKFIFDDYYKECVNFLTYIWQLLRDNHIVTVSFNNWNFLYFVSNFKYFCSFSLLHQAVQDTLIHCCCLVE